ncbi:Ig-like domain-containing protein [Terriglobus aquaticus]|uniref:Ig-like domain-containing protein n=1 Tax=Terriglobus aquaticus TaxID=940139 RepID=A0ABW9KF42_9BACT|nr:Ig-like domain-containing protein [Terriglobus aquaticus]
MAETPAKPAENAAGSHAMSVGTRATTTTALTVASSESGSSSGVTLLATVDGKSHATPAGSVVFTIGGKRIGQAAVANGSATLTLDTLPAGLSSLAAAYEGDSNFLPSQSAPVRFYNDDGK